MTRQAAAAAAAIVAAGPAAAHSPVPGIEGFYTGLLHIFVEPALLVGCLATAVLTLQDWPRRFRLGWPVFAAGLIVGLAAARAMTDTLPMEPVLFGLAGLCAALAALSGDRATPVALPIIAAAAAAIGLVALPDPGPVRDVLITTGGTIVGANLALLVAGGALDWLCQRHDGPVLWIALRISASWLAAIALMLFAFVASRPA